jgi:hypothetical protein
VAQRIVDGLEIVEVEEQERELPPVALGVRDCLGDAVLQQIAVR